MILFGLFAACQPNTSERANIEKPNIVLILADDLGYGDVSAYNSEARLSTPNLDKLTTEGMHFTDAHSPSSVCTPTRYALLTGEYCWRSSLPVGVLWGYGRTFIPKEKPTLASFLKANGYQTGIVGKWHLGIDWQVKEGFQDSLANIKNNLSEVGAVQDVDPDWLDFSRPPTTGPLDYGFDYSFILPASLDMAPYCYLENDTLVGDLAAFTPGNDLKTGYTEAFWRPGLMSSDFVFDQVLPKFVDKAMNYINASAQSEAPFFLYLPLAAPHTPWLPTAPFDDTSGAGTYGDFVQMVDAAIGEVLKLLQEKGISENTLVIVTSDNGPFWRDDYEELYQHSATGGYKGMKADIWEGGHRVPLIYRWPGKIRPGAKNEYPVTLTTFMATFAEMLNVPYDTLSAGDSQSSWPFLMGEKPDSLLPIIHHSSRGMFAIRDGDWKMVEGLGSGGFSKPTFIEPEGKMPAGQLYNLKNDPYEQLNVYRQYPDRVKKLSAELQTIRGN